MLNKKLIKNNFKKSIKTYNDNASIQKHIADKLIELIDKKKYLNILEIGSYTGVLTEKTVNFNPNFKKYIAVDIVEESKNYIQNIDKRIEFINSDIEEFKTDEKFDLIISSASLQWCSDFFVIFKKLKSYLAKDGKLAISIFKDGNLSEIKKAFEVELNYPNEKYILNMKKEGILSNNAIIKEETTPLKFNNPIDILKHLKYTGVNSIKTNLPYSKIKQGLKILNNDFKNTITYKPLYIID